MLDRLLVVLDQFDSSEVACTAALDLAAAHDSALLFVGILPSLKVPLLDGPSPSLLGAAAFQRTSEAMVRSRIDDALREASRRGRRAAFHLLDPPQRAMSVVSLAAAEGCDTIVVASDGRSAIGRLFAGSLIPGLITHAPMPVLVCKPSQDHTPVRSASHVSTADAILAWRQRNHRGAISGRLAGAPL